MKEMAISDFEATRCLDGKLVVLLDPQYENAQDDVTQNSTPGTQFQSFLNDFRMASWFIWGIVDSVLSIFSLF